MKNKHLTYENRIFLDALIRSEHYKYNLKEIAQQLDKNASTISRELKRNRIPGAKTNYLGDCKIENQFPYVCNGCKKKSYCKCQKYYYNPKKAEATYKFKLKHSRTAITMDMDQLEYWDELFRNRIGEKGQPTLHVFKSISFPRSLSTFYRYVDKELFPSFHNEMLPRKYSFKSRKTRKEKEFSNYINIHNPVKIGRTYKDFLEYVKNHPDQNIVEMDTVIGKQKDKSCFLTILFRKSKLMLIYKIKHYDTQSIIDVFNNIKSSIGSEKFKELFPIILTDNGWEFSRPDEIEVDPLTGEKLCNVFYCDANKSWQKPFIERNHEFIRYIIPKGITFDDITKKNTIDIMNHINSVKRLSLNNSTPFELFSQSFSKDICDKLNLVEIKSDKINLTYTLIK